MIFIAAYILLMAALQVASLRMGLGGRGRMILRAGAAGGLLVLGALALASIGLALVVASLLTFVSAGMVAVEKGPSAVVFSGAAALLAVVVLVAGFEVTERIVFCPTHGYMGGGGTGFITGPYHYECVNGQFKWRSGLCLRGGATIDANGNVVSATGC